MKRDPDRAGFRHEALFYASPEELLAGTVPFVRAGVRLGESVLVALPKDNLELLRSALNGEGERVRFLDMEELGRNPGRIISAWRDFLDASSGRRIRGVGEPVWAGRSDAEVQECERHEALLNLAFADSLPWTLMCPYDTSRLDAGVLRSAEHTHPLVCMGAGDPRDSGGYRAPVDQPGPFSGELSAPADAAALSFDVGRLSEVRRFVSAAAASEGLDPERVGDLVLAANELATNSIRHGGGSGEIALWRDGAHVVCEVRDGGWIREPLVGRERPERGQTGGRGLWLVNQLCDLVQIRSAQSGTTVRMQMLLGADGSQGPAA